MRRLLAVLFILTALAALGLSAMAPEHPLTQQSQAAALALLALNVLVRLLRLFPARRTVRIPPSQVAEIERLYFRAMRELINDEPNLPQAINDLQRILSIDSRYRNAQHYLNRALWMQAQGASNGTGRFTPSRTSAEFMRLQERLIDPSPEVRKSVVMELIQYGEIATDPLIALLMDEDPDVRVHAATALGWVGGQSAIQPLLVALQDSNPYVRRYAARALCWVVDESAIDTLIDALRDEDNYVRRYAARALGWSQDARAVRPLLELLAVEQNNDVREYALTALDDLGERPTRVERPIKLEE